MTLVNPAILTDPDPIDILILDTLGFKKDSEVIDDGLIRIGNWNPEFQYAVTDGFNRRYDDDPSVASWQNAISRVPNVQFMKLSEDVAKFYEEKLADENLSKRDREMIEGFKRINTEFPLYGVVETIEYFIENLASFLVDAQEDLCVFFVHVAKNPSNKSKGGGWRWHKWGGFFGENEPTCEYLDDEDGFDDGVYTFHVYKVMEHAQT